VIIPGPAVDGEIALFDTTSGKRIKSSGGVKVSTDQTMAANSDLNLPTEKAVRAYIDGLNGVVDVRTYGAVGDGATDDTSAIQAAINAAASTGAICYFSPTGYSYRITAPLVCSTQNASYHLYGNGYGSKIFLDAATNVSAIRSLPGSLTDTTRIPTLWIKGLNFIQPTTATSNSNSVLRVSNQQEFIFQDCYVYGYYRGLEILTSYGFEILGNSFSGVKEFSIVSPDSSINEANLIQNKFYNCGVATGAQTVVFSGSSDGGLLILSNDLEGCYAGFNFGNAIDAATFVGNYMEGAVSADIFWSNGPSTGWLVSGNKFGSGVTENWGSIKGFDIRNNVFAGGAGTITIDNTASDISLLHNKIYAGTSLINNSLGSAPKTITADYVVADYDNHIIVNKPSSACVLTLPSASARGAGGREIVVKTLQGLAVNSASSNVIGLANVSPGTAILAAMAGKWAKLKSDGTNWVIMEGN